jgi:hypothetical protein
MYLSSKPVIHHNLDDGVDVLTTASTTGSTNGWPRQGAEDRLAPLALSGTAEARFRGIWASRLYASPSGISLGPAVSDALMSSIDKTRGRRMHLL